MRSVVAILLCALLTSCMTGNKYAEKMNAWIGHSKEDLIERFGAPNKTATDGDTEYVEYHHARGRNGHGTQGSCSSQAIGKTVYATQAGGYPACHHPKWCNETFTISNGVITAWAAKGNSCRP